MIGERGEPACRSALDDHSGEAGVLFTRQRTGARRDLRAVRRRERREGATKSAPTKEPSQGSCTTVILAKATVRKLKSPIQIGRCDEPVHTGNSFAKSSMYALLKRSLAHRLMAAGASRYSRLPLSRDK